MPKLRGRPKAKPPPLPPANAPPPITAMATVDYDAGSEPESSVLAQLSTAYASVQRTLSEHAEATAELCSTRGKLDASRAAAEGAEAREARVTRKFRELESFSASQQDQLCKVSKTLESEKAAQSEKTEQLVASERQLSEIGSQLAQLMSERQEAERRLARPAIHCRTPAMILSWICSHIS